MSVPGFILNITILCMQSSGLILSYKFRPSLDYFRTQISWANIYPIYYTLLFIPSFIFHSPSLLPSSFPFLSICFYVSPYFPVYLSSCISLCLPLLSCISLVAHPISFLLSFLLLLVGSGLLFCSIILQMEFNSFLPVFSLNNSPICKH